MGIVVRAAIVPLVLLLATGCATVARDEASAATESSSGPTPAGQESAPPGSRPARTFLGGQVTRTERDYPDIDPGKGGRLFFAHRVPDSPLQIEFGYMDGGDADIDTGDPSVTATMDYRGLDALASLGLPVGQDPESRLWVGAGFYDGDTKVKVRFEEEGEVFAGSASESASGLQYGVGLDWAVSRKVAVRLDYRVLTDVSDFVDDRDLKVLGAGLTFSIGADTPPSPSRPQAGPATPATTAMVPAASPSMDGPGAPAPLEPVQGSAPAAASIPAASTAAPEPALAPGGRARLRTGVLRTRPQLGAATRAAPTDAILELKGSARNAEGDWWYVGGGASGWAPASDLTPVP